MIMIVIEIVMCRFCGFSPRHLLWSRRLSGSGTATLAMACSCTSTKRRSSAAVVGNKAGPTTVAFETQSTSSEVVR